MSSSSVVVASGSAQPVPSSSSSKKVAKRKVEDNGSDSEAGGSAKGKRNRVHFSCVECNRRKQKCDRQTPCSHCIARKVPHLCRPFVNGVEDPNHYEQDVRSRLDRIEDLLKDLRDASAAHSHHSHAAIGGSSSSSAHPGAPHYLPPININGRSSSAVPSSVSPRPASIQPLRLSFSGSNASDGGRGGSGNGGEGEDDDDEDGQMGTMSGGRFYGPSAMSSVSSSRMNKILQDFPTTSIGTASLSLPLPSPTLPSLPSSASNAGPTPSSGRHRLYPPGSLPPKFESAMDILDESGISMENIISLLDKLPERGVRNALVELYWREIDWTRYKIYQPSFQARYIHFFSHETEQNLQHAYPWQNLDAASLKWLPLLFIMMAIATLTAPLSLFGDEDKRRSMSRKLYGSARKAMNIAQALQRDNVDIVMAGLLIARYLLLVHRAAEGFTPLTAALQLGLYRDGSHLGMADKREIELRRRLWSYVFHHDRTASLLVGRPTLIPESSVDTLPPANLDDHDLLGDFPVEGKPMSQPTVMTHAVLRHALAVIMGKISDKIFSLKSPRYETVVELDQELIAWKHDLPSYFKLEHPDKSMDNQYHYLAFHRQMLASEFYYTRILLHRPFILRRRDSTTYDYSRRAAIEAARADLIGRRDFQLNKPAHLGKLSVAAYWVLNSYIIIGIAILLDPTSSQAEELRNLLNVVTGRTPDQDGRVSIATVRELAIVELFSQKEKNINSASLPSSPTGAGAVPYPNPPPLQMEQSSSPYAGASQPFNLSQNRSPGQPHKTERQEHDFLAPPRQNSISSNGGGSGANLAAASRQTASPGLWGRPDPVDELLLSYHRAKGDSVAESNMLQGQLQQAGVGGTSSGRPAASDSAWSAKAIGMGDHKFNQPFAQSPHSLASPQTRPLQPAQGLTFQQASYSLSPLASTATSRSQQPTSPSLGGGGTNGGGNANTSADGVFGGGLGGTAFDQMDFTSPWTHGVHAFTGATGVVGSTESPEAGDGFGDLLGDAKEIAFLNQLISAISSGDGPSL